MLYHIFRDQSKIGTSFNSIDFSSVDYSNYDPDNLNKSDDISYNSDDTVRNRLNIK